MLTVYYTTEGRMHAKERGGNVGKIKLCSLGPYPNTYVSVSRNQSYRSSTLYFCLFVFFMDEVNPAFCRSATFGDLCGGTEVN